MPERREGAEIVAGTPAGVRKSLAERREGAEIVAGTPAGVRRSLLERETAALGGRFGKLEAEVIA